MRTAADKARREQIGLMIMLTAVALQVVALKLRGHY